MTAFDNTGSYAYPTHLIYYQQRTQGSYADHEPGLWRAVITQALMDASNHSRKPEAKRDRDTALRWLLDDGHDFEDVCDNAGFDPGYVRRRAREALARDCEWRLPSGQGWRVQLRLAQQRELEPTIH